MKKKVLASFILIFLLFVSACKNREIYNFLSDEDFSRFVTNKYSLADNRYDAGRYYKAIKYYQEVINAYEYNKNNEVFYLLPSENVVDKIKIFEKYYYSLYNIACSFALLGKYEDADTYLQKAIYAGYPHLDYLLKDEDLQSYFSRNTDLKNKILNLYQKCNNSTLIANKIILHGRGPSSGDKYIFCDDGISVVMHDVSVDAKGNYKLNGTYKIINNFIVIDFTDENYLETKGYILGVGIQEEDCEKIHNKVSLRHIIPMFSIGNNKTYYEWPFVIYYTK